jgi:hypothetical protein
VCDTKTPAGLQIAQGQKIEYETNFAIYLVQNAYINSNAENKLALSVEDFLAALRLYHIACNRFVYNDNNLRS